MNFIATEHEIEQNLVAEPMTGAASLCVYCVYSSEYRVHYAVWPFAIHVYLCVDLCTGNPYIRTSNTSTECNRSRCFVDSICWQLKRFIFAHGKCTITYRSMYKHIGTWLDWFCVCVMCGHVCMRVPARWIHNEFIFFGAGKANAAMMWCIIITIHHHRWQFKVTFDVEFEFAKCQKVPLIVIGQWTLSIERNANSIVILRSNPQL